MDAGSPADCVMAVARQAAWSTLLRSRPNPARPYMVRLIVFSRLIWPSTGPVDHGVSSAARTAAEILPEALGEALERRPGRGGEPPVQRSRSLLPDQGGEAAGETADLGQGGRLGQQPVEERAVRARQLARVGLDQAGQPEPSRAASSLPRPPASGRARPARPGGAAWPTPAPSTGRLRSPGRRAPATASSRCASLRPSAAPADPGRAPGSRRSPAGPKCRVRPRATTCARSCGRARRPARWR